MSPRHASGQRVRIVRHARGQRRHALRWSLSLLLVAALSFTATGAATAYLRLQNNITSADVDHLLGEDRPVAATPDPDDPNSGVAVNILVMGTDTRDGVQDVLDDGGSGGGSDTTIVVHVSADRQRVDLVSIPRDSLVEIPACQRSDGTTSQARSSEMFNAAYNIGGVSGEVTDAAACTLRTVEQNTGVRIDHFVVVNMSGFVDMVDALGGVPICIPQEIDSPKADNLHLLPGNQVLDGRTALQYARARSGLGMDGSDTGRIERQQRLLAATADSVLSKNLLLDVPELVRFLSAATKSLTVSSGISSIPDMAGLAFSLREVSGGNISFMTIPFGAAPSDPNRVVWTPEADDIWARIAEDRPLVDPEPEPEPSTPTGEDPAEGEAPAGDEPAPTTPPGGPFTVDDIPEICG